MPEEDQAIRNTIDALLQPDTTPRTNLLTVADLYCGDGEITRAATELGLYVNYAYDPDETTIDRHFDEFGSEPFGGSVNDSLEVAPKFNLLVMRLTENTLSTEGEDDAPIEHVMRFWREREPAGILLIGDDLPRGATDQIWDMVRPEAERLGYRVERRTSDHTVAIISVKKFMQFEWPAVITPMSVMLAFTQATV